MGSKKAPISDAIIVAVASRFRGGVELEELAREGSGNRAWTSPAMQASVARTKRPRCRPWRGARTPEAMLFGSATRAGPVPNADKLELLNRYYAWRRTPEGAAFVRRSHD
jgi:hypothetical protein